MRIAASGGHGLGKRRGPKHPERDKPSKRVPLWGKPPTGCGPFEAATARNLGVARGRFSGMEQSTCRETAGTSVVVSEESLGTEEPRKGKRKGRTINRVLGISLLLGVYAVGVFLRWEIVSDLRRHYEDLPYTLESTLLFHYADMVAKGQPIPAVDKRAQYPEGLEVARKFSVGKGLAAAAIYTAAGRPGSFREFVRHFDAAWFCFGIFAVFLAVRELGGGYSGGLMAAAFYAISLASVSRSTGLEFSRENFSLPLIFLHWWLMVREWKRPTLSWGSIAAGVVVAVAAATWDVTQLYVLMLGIFAGLGLLFGKNGYRLIRGFLPGLAFLVVAGATVPYLRDHSFLLSWGMLLWYSLAAAYAAHSVLAKRSSALPKVVFLVVQVSLAALVITQTSYPGTYSHFTRLLAAKVKHFNVKPLNPAELTYEARILWTPALHSATSKFHGKYPISDFEVLFVLSAAPLVLLMRSLFRRTSSQGEKSLLFSAAVFFVLYVLFVRMQVFLVFFLSCLVGLGFRYGPSLFRHGSAKTAAAVGWALIGCLGLWAEALTYFPVERIGRIAYTGNPYAANKELVNWLRNNTEKDAVVLAGFTLEPTLFTDADRAIVLHPKFESKGMRLKVKEYLETLFSENEKDFHDFCLKNGVNYYVLHPGVFSGPGNRDWIYSNRYMVDRAERDPEYASLMMKISPERLQYFRNVTDISQKGDLFGFFYRVFKVVSKEEIEEAEQHTRNGRMYLDNYNAKPEKATLQRAMDELLRAVELFPGDAEAHSMLSTIYIVKGERDKASQEIERCKQILADRAY
jgi:hypothetical protein